MFNRIISSIDRICTIGTVTGLICLGLISLGVVFEVFTRFVLNSPTTWTEEYIRYLVIWAAFGAAAYTLREERHIKVDFVVNRLSGKARDIIQLCVDGISLSFCVIVFWYGIDIVIDNIRFEIVSTTSAEVPMYIPRLAIPCSALLLMFQFLSRIGQLMSRMIKRGE